ncbi:5-hydroxyisourate hydrolase [Rhizoctonia solani]|uniref:5-hydroxyisourate hydrolase n=1 Tax=Rhizoctonia solani TaxID=456999 RepID=A0A0K6FTR9_9AGAM|nr:5-hydroxyisourate hydrolase [Rhizoctonia solani]
MAPTKSPVTCHVLDSTLGKPAANVKVRLEAMEGSTFLTLASGQTDSDGRCTTLLPAEPRLNAGIYKMIFNTGEYFEKDKRDTFYPVVEIIFHLAKPDEHYHIPLLLSPWSYTTYRGS